MTVGDVMAGAEVIVTDLKMEEGTTNQEMQTGKGKEQIWNLRKECSPTDTLILA